MPWLHLPSVTATQGSITVAVNNAFETEHVQIGDALLIGQFAPVEIVGIHSRQLTLRDAWPNATQTAQAGAIIPTAADFQLAASLLRDATTVTQGNFAAMEKWWTENTDVTFTAYDGSKHSVPSAKKMQDNALVKGMSSYEHQYNKVRNALREIYDAGGFVNWGNGYQGANVAHIKDINHGMWTDTNNPNNLRMGVAAGTVGATGKSITPYPVLNIAGHEIHVRGINHTNADTNKLFFQGAEDGTTVTDSTGNCRGSGKAVLNLKTDIDPKYGNAPTGTAAEILRESVGRAFEGIVINGDFRNSDLSKWSSGGGSLSIVDHKLNCVVSASNASNHQVRVPVTAGDSMIFEFSAIDTGSLTTPQLAVYDRTNTAFITIQTYPTGQGRRSIRFTVPSGCTEVACYVNSNSIGTGTLVVGNVSVRKVTEDVLTRAVDLKYLEVWEEEDELEFFPYGSVQSGLTTVDGFTTEASSRPDTYRAVFPGDTASSKQCLKIAKLSFVEIAKLMSNPKHNWFYNEAGKPTQVRYRDCARRGAGNGDWLSINPNVDGLKYSQQATVVPQGMKDLAPSPGTTDKYIASPSHATATFVGEVNSGVYIARNTEAGIAYKGECYALVLCTVPRLNQGMASHINAFGTKKASDSKSWHETTVDFSSLADCFNPAKLLTASGEIGTPSGHQDGLLHNAIYASGFNGVIDHRQPAKSPQDDWKESLQGFYAAKVRGVQKLPFTKADSTYVTINWNGNVGVYNTQSMYFAQDPGSPQSRYLPDWKVILLTQGSETVVLERDNTRSSSKFNGDGAWPNANNNCYVINVKDFTNKVAEVQSKFRAGNVEIQVVVQNELDTSVSGAFSCNTIIADPAEWVQTPQIAQGVIGYWCLGVPDGTSKAFAFNRKALSTSVAQTYTATNGTNWAVASVTIDEANNNWTNSLAANYIVINTYKAYAYQVEDGSNSAPVGGEKGYGRVFAKQHHLVALGCLTIEGFIHKVVTNDNSKNAYSDGLAVLKANLHSTGQISTGSPERYPLHQPLDLLAPTNNSPACKALPFLVEKNGYLYIAWHVNELGYTNPPTIGTVSGTANFAVDNHSLNRVDGGSMNGVVVMRVGGAASNTSLINCFVSSDGAVRNADGTDLTQWWVVWNGSGWGDDSKIKVTSKGWDNFVDTNGIVRDRRVVISTQPIGPAKKKTLVGGLSSPA